MVFELAKYKVVVNRELCIGCGVAPAICPEVFTLDPDTGKTMVVDKYAVENKNEISIGVVPGELYECIKHAAEACPVGAIKIEEVVE